MEEEKTKKAAELLMAGGKMLGIHCGKCMSPLFEFEGKVVCPMCSSKKPHEENELLALEKTLRQKLKMLTEKLEKETDPAKTIELLSSIKGTLEALEKLKK
ncbi:MAG: Sjogren's syndrome/scleroderma autoantigen 1 family protein [Candidatus Hadarchaeales archaeon]